MRIMALSKENIVRLLRERQGTQSLRAYARSLNCSAAYLSDVYADKREPGPKLLEALGIAKETKIIRKTIYRWR